MNNRLSNSSKSGAIKMKDDNKDANKEEILKRAEEGFYEDPRYEQCNKEAIYGIGLGLLNLIWWYGFGYGLGKGPVAEYKYIFGLPAWFFMSCILGSIVFIGLTFLMVNKKLEDMPLDRFTKEEAEEYVLNKENRGKNDEKY